MMDESVKHVLGENVFWYKFTRYGDILRALKVGAQEKVSDVKISESGICAMVAAIGNN